MGKLRQRSSTLQHLRGAAYIEAQHATAILKKSPVLDAICFNPFRFQEELLGALDALASVDVVDKTYALKEYDKLRFIHYKDLKNWCIQDHMAMQVDHNTGGALAALVRKLKHLALPHSQGYVGDPASIIPFLQSIVKGKIKVWNTETWNRVKYRERRKQFTTQEGVSQEYFKNNGFGRDDEGAHYYGNFISGHFREGFKAWTLTPAEIKHVKEFFNL